MIQSKLDLVFRNLLFHGLYLYKIEATYDGITFSNPVDIDTTIQCDGYPAVTGTPSDGVYEGFDILAVLDAANGLPYPDDWAPVP